VYSQEGWISKHLLANIALVLPSLSLPSFSVFPRLLLLHDIVVTRHAHENPPQLLYVFVCFFSLFFSLFFFFFFLYLMMIRLEIVILIRNPRTHKHQRFFFPKTVLAFTALFGCGFFRGRRRMLLLLLLFFERVVVAEKKEVLSRVKSI
jgi:hypothetical protein